MAISAIIERAAPQDAQEILELQKIAYQSEAALHNDYTIPPLTQTLEEMRAELDRQLFLKATSEGRIAGSVRAFVRDGTCFVGRLIVHPDWQNQGLGARLLSEIESAFGQVHRFELFTGHMSERNLAFYAKRGYRPFKERKVSDALTLVFLEKQRAEHRIAVLPGDGIGVEVIAEAEKVLIAVGERFGQRFVLEHGLAGGAAMDATGEPLPEATLALCRPAAAVLLGAVGDPKYDDPRARVRPEQALLGLRKGLGLFANLRPVWVYPALTGVSPLRPELLGGVDLVVVRELTGGLYFGEPRVEGSERAVDTMVYTRAEVERIAHVAFGLARQRRGKVTSVDKANMLACSRLWRQTVEAVGKDYPGIQLEHLLVDAAAMHLMKRPRDFDVILTGNMFGDILSDEAAVLAGSMGMLPSASLGEGRFGLYEPVHGTAPDIAGRGIANPLAAILSAAMLLRHSLEMEAEARAVEAAVAAVLDAGYRTPDIAAPGRPTATTRQIGDLVVEALAGS